MNYLKLLGLVSLLLIFSCGEDSNYPNTLLWKIEGNGLELPSYLFGTIHITCEPYLTDKITRALDASEVLLMELHPDEIWSEEIDEDYVDFEYSLPEGKTLHDYMSAEQYRMVRKYLMEFGEYDIDDDPTIHPSYLSLYRVPPELNCPLYDSFEGALTTYAYNNDMELGGLETLKIRSTIISKTPVEPHIKYLLREVKSGKPASNDAIRLQLIHYKNEDLNGIQRIVLSDKYTKTWRSNPEVLDKRNFYWMPKIDSIAKKRPAFFGVGAAHLVGENGLISLLEAKGYTLTPVF